jgi:hypothetical protein
MLYIVPTAELPYCSTYPRLEMIAITRESTTGGNPTETKTEATELEMALKETGNLGTACCSRYWQLGQASGCSRSSKTLSGWQGGGLGLPSSCHLLDRATKPPRILVPSAGSKSEPVADDRSDQKALNLREEHRWQREEQRWKKWRDKHQAEARRWAEVRERLEEESVVLQKKLAQRNSVSLQSEGSKGPVEGRNKGRSPIEEAELEVVTEWANELGGDAAERYLRTGGASLSRIAIDCSETSDSVSKNKVDEDFELLAAGLQPRRSTDTKDDALWVKNIVNSRDEAWNSSNVGDVIDLDNLNRGQSMTRTASQDLSPKVESNFRSGSGTKMPVDQVESKSIAREPKLKHFNEHVHVHNYLRHHHMQWWMKTHGPAQQDGTSRTLLSEADSFSKEEAERRLEMLPAAAHRETGQGKEDGT